ncbi:MAG: threonine dehydratase [Pirellulaceae bacterium]|jgi:threonine dehydratase|nr:threonine dehydratase [Pirellulaceae bacterium]MDP6556224.1 threonine dehydratase [Pirellulaceae bacterium]MDP6723101.1 threonine dehydratase [Pirellulaceae bacterium]
MLPVTYLDIEAALPRVHAVLQPTPLIQWPGLSQQLDCAIYVKHENHQPVGAFKVRGGVNLASTLTDQERTEGLLGVSTGNHGQSLAFAARHVACPCTIVVPANGNQDKNRAMRQLGADLIEHGRDFEEAREHLEQLLETRGGRYVHSANEPLLIAGVGSMAWEIFARLPEPDVILVPIGLGSGVCGTCIVAKHRRPQTKVIGVQAANASSVARSWASGKLESDERIDTWAEGLATRVPAEMTLEIMRELMDDVILVEEDEMRAAAFELLRQTHNLAEGAGAATLAAATQQKDRFRGQRVVAILSGGNLDLTELPRILAAGEGLPNR